MNRAATASTSPGTPATKNAAGQPWCSATAPLTKKLSANPSGRPSMNTDIARARRSAGTRSPISELAAGAQLASPTPTPSRSTNSDQKPHANPEAKVNRLHRPTPAARSHLRRPTSASRPSGRPTTAYSRMNAVPSQPSWLSDRSHSLRIFSWTAPRTWRSKKFMVLMPSRTQKVKARCGVLCMDLARQPR